MASWKEIEAIRRDPVRFKFIAEHLLALNGALFSDWETNYLESLSRFERELTTRQAEKLLEIRDGVELLKEIGHDRLSARLLIEGCFLARLDLSKNDEDWITRIRANNPTTIRRRDAGRLLRCARELYLID
jgi:hypothetical protein